MGIVRHSAQFIETPEPPLPSRGGRRRRVFLAVLGLSTAYEAGGDEVTGLPEGVGKLVGLFLTPAVAAGHFVSWNGDTHRPRIAAYSLPNGDEAEVGADLSLLIGIACMAVYEQG